MVASTGNFGSLMAGGTQVLAYFFPAFIDIFPQSFGRGISGVSGTGVSGTANTLPGKRRCLNTPCHCSYSASCGISMPAPPTARHTRGGIRLPVLLNGASSLSWWAWCTDHGVLIMVSDSIFSPVLMPYLFLLTISPDVWLVTKRLPGLA